MDQQSTGGGRMRRFGRGLRRHTPNYLTAILAAGAISPAVVEALAGFGGIGVASLGAAVGAVGGNLLTDIVKSGIGKIDEEGRSRTADNIEDVVAALIEHDLEAGGLRASALRAEIAEVLRSDDVSAAIQDAVSSGNEVLKEALFEALAQLGENSARFHSALRDVGRSAGEILHTLRQQDARQRAARDEGRQRMVELQLIRGELAAIAQRPGRAGVYRSRFVAAGDIVPYRGLAPFQEDDFELFYGREKEQAKLVGTVLERLSAPGILIVSGASGTGKSSLLRAGLAAQIARGTAAPGSERWPRLLLTPTGDPMLELATRLGAQAGVTAGAVRERLGQHPQEAASLAYQALVRARGAARLLIVVDQFEEVFTHNRDDRPHQAFVTALHAAATVPVGTDRQPAALVVIGVRGDYWERCAAYPELLPSLDEPFNVTPMVPADLRRCIVGPAMAAALELEPGLAEEILGDLGATADGGVSAGALPLLSQAMLLTWQHREGNRLTSRSYALSGGVADAVSNSAEQVLGTLSKDQEVLAEQIFRSLTIIRAPQIYARRRMVRTDLPAGTDADAVIDAYAEKRLLVLGDETVEISHDELLRSWARLRNWLKDDEADQLIFSDLEQRAGVWRRRNRDRSVLYHDLELSIANQVRERWLADSERRQALPAVVSDFLAASNRHQSRRLRFRRLVTAVVAGLALVAGVTALVATRNARIADQQRTLGLSRQLAAQSDTIAPTDPLGAQHLAVAAWKVSPTPEAYQAMLSALASPQQAALSGHSGYVHGIAYTADGKTIATASDDGTVRLWDTDRLRGVGSLPVSGTGRQLVVAFNPRRPMLATAGDDRKIHLWDTGTLHEIGSPLLGHKSSIDALIFAPDGRTIVSAGQDGTIRWWDVSTMQAIGAPVNGQGGAINTLALSPDGEMLASAGQDGAVRLWSLADRRQVGTTMRGNKGFVNAVVFRGDGKVLIAGGNLGVLRMWNVATGTSIGKPIQNSQSILSLAIEPAGSIIAIAGGGRVVQLLDSSTGRFIGGPFAGTAGYVTGVAFDPAGKGLATVGVDYLLRLWNLSAMRPYGVTVAGKSIVRQIAYTHDGAMMATADDDGTIRLWHTRPVSPAGGAIIGLPGSAFSVGFSPDGRTVAAGYRDGSIRLWDAATHRQIGNPLVRHRAYVMSVSFSADGSRLVSVSQDSVRIWNATTAEPDGAAMATKGNVMAAQPSPDGSTVTTVDVYGQMLTWDIARHRVVGGAFTGDTDAATTTLSLSSDGRTLATAGIGGSVRLWDTSSRHTVGQPMNSSPLPLLATAFSPDGRLLAVAGQGGLIQLWDTTTRRPVGEPFGDPAVLVFSLTFNPSGRELVVGGSNGGVSFWDTSAYLDPRAAICAHAGPVTTAEWKQYAVVGAMPHTC